MGTSKISCCGARAYVAVLRLPSASHAVPRTARVSCAFSTMIDVPRDCALYPGL